jgi:phosphoserine phosphatase RsbU/P
MRQWIGRIGRLASLSDERVFDLQVVASEAIANGIEHAASEIDVAAWVMPDRLLVEITNDGVFRPGIYKDETRRRRGLGLPLMVSLADQVHVSRLPNDRTRVSLTFFADRPTAPAAEEAPARSSRRWLLGWLMLPLPLLVALVLVFWAVGEVGAHDSQPLLTAFNTLFVSAACLAVAAFAGSSCLRTGSVAVLVLGAGSVIVALGFLLSGPLLTDPNALLAVHNSSVLVAAVLFAASAIIALLPRPLVLKTARAWVLVGTYLAAAGFVVLIALLATAGALPAFVDGNGYTAVRKVVLSFAVIAFVVAAIGYAWLYRRQASGFVVFAAGAFACFAVGLGVLLLAEPALGSPINWAGRAGQWMGGLYLFAAIYSLQHSGSSVLELERSLHEVEDRYRALVNTSPEAILVHSQGRYVFANPAAERLFGTAGAEAILGGDVRRFLHPDTAPAELARIDQAYAGGISPPAETRLLRLDGTPFVAEVSRSQIRWAGRVAVQTVIRDITERKQTEAALRKSEERHRVLAEENERLYRQQLGIAETLQMALISIPSLDGRVRLGHLYRSATEAARVGGDFYDVFDVKGSQLALLVGDVSGHGIQAARMATLVKDVVHAFIHQSLHTDEVLRRTNGLLVEKGQPGFVTLFLAILDPDTGSLRYSSAGHPRPMLLRASGEVESLSSGSLPLGVFADATWTSGQASMGPGDRLLLYTDGVTEARDGAELFGEERLAELLRLAATPVEDVPGLILEQVLVFSGGSLGDDIAVLAISLAEPS